MKYFIRKYLRTSKNGIEHIVSSHQRETTIKNSFITTAVCPVCKKSVFFYTNSNNSRVFFDALGGDWDKHPCTDLSLIKDIKDLGYFSDLHEMHKEIFKQCMKAAKKDDYSEFNRILKQIKNNEQKELIVIWLKTFFPVRIVKIKDGSYSVRKNKKKLISENCLKKAKKIPFYNIKNLDQTSKRSHKSLCIPEVTSSFSGK